MPGVDFLIHRLVLGSIPLGIILMAGVGFLIYRLVLGSIPLGINRLVATLMAGVGFLKYRLVLGSIPLGIILLVAALMAGVVYRSCNKLSFSFANFFLINMLLQSICNVVARLAKQFKFRKVFECVIILIHY